MALTATNAYGNNTNTKNNYITAGNAPVANFSGTPTIGRADLGGDVYRQFHELADGVVVDVRGLHLFDGAEPEPLVYRGGLLHRRADGDQRLWE